MGPAASTKSTPGLSEASDKFLIAKTRRAPAALPTVIRCGEAPSSEKLPSLASFRSARVLTSLYSAFSNPVLQRLGYGMVQHEARATRADRGQLFRCWPNGSADAFCAG